MKAIFKRISIVPFEFAIAILALGSGLSSFFKVGLVDPVNQLLPAWEAGVLNSGLVLCGFLLIYGISRASAALESLGLWILNAVILSRFFLYGHFFHYNSAFYLMGIFDLAIILAGFVRLRTIRTNHILIKLKKDDTGDLFNS